LGLANRVSAHTSEHVRSVISIDESVRFSRGTPGLIAFSQHNCMQGRMLDAEIPIKWR
jgi:hypothetical protein